MWPLPGMTWKDDPKQGIQSKVRGNKGVSSRLNAPLMKTSRGCDVTLRRPHPAGQPRPLVDKLRNAAKQTSKSKMLQKKQPFSAKSIFCETRSVSRSRVVLCKHTRVCLSYRLFGATFISVGSPLFPHKSEDFCFQLGIISKHV